jgi:hypothetical protein
MATPPLAMLNHRSSDSGIPAESHKLGGLVLEQSAKVLEALEQQRKK